MLQRDEKQLKEEIIQVPDTEDRSASEASANPLLLLYDESLCFFLKATIFQQDIKHFNPQIAIFHFVACPVFLTYLQGVSTLQVGGVEAKTLALLLGSLAAFYELKYKFPRILHTLLAIGCSILWCKTIVEVLIDFIMVKPRSNS